MNTPTSPAPRSSRAASLFVAAGILASRIVGLLRERVVASCFGTGLQADVFSAGLRMPNVLQNLLGEGTLSASFIPAYSALIGEGRTKEAGRLAGAVFSLLLAIAGAIALLGIVLAPWLVAVFTPGFQGERRELMIAVVRILFPMTGILVLSAWALGILNSHRRFFLPYFAPVLWNAAIIGALLAARGRVDANALLMAGAWGALAGGLLQFGIQLPWVLKLQKGIRPSLGRSMPAFRETLGNLGPAVLGRGVVQLSGYVDMVLASLLAVGAPARLRYAQTLYVLPVSLFAMSIAAAELPELARERGSGVEALRTRAVAALRRSAFFVVPSLVAFVALGDVLVAGIYQTGEFGAADVTIVRLILAAYSLGLLASTSTRIYQSAFYAQGNTRTPARIAALRVLVSAIAGTGLMLQFEPVRLGAFTLGGGAFAGLTVAGLPLGPVGLGLGAAVGAWLEWALLKRGLARRIGAISTGGARLTQLFAAALLAAVVALLLRHWLPPLRPVIAAVLFAGTFGACYLATTLALGVDEARAFLGTLARRFRRRS